MRYEVSTLDENTQLISRIAYREWSTACYHAREAINQGGHHVFLWDLQQDSHGRMVYELTSDDKGGR